MSDIFCIYHGNCADGFGSAYAVRDFAIRHDLTVEFYAASYGQEPPDVLDKRVVMVDFSYKRPVLEIMSEKAQSILILDHHKSAAEDLKGYPKPPIDPPGRKGWLPLRGICAEFDMGRSGAGMTWDHFCGGPRPALINHIEDRDLWRFALPKTRDIQAAVFSYPYDFAVWDQLMLRDTDDLAAEGEAIMRKQMKDIAEFIEATGHEITIDGHKVPALNAPYFWSSEAGNIMAKNKPFAACYWRDKDGYVFSLRSNDDGLDVSEIAVKFGGGGHRNAAGFKVSSLAALSTIKEESNGPRDNQGDDGG